MSSVDPRAAVETQQSAVDEDGAGEQDAVKQIREAVNVVDQVKQGRVAGIAEGSVDDIRWRRSYFQAVRSLIGTVRHYLQNKHIDTSEQYWQSVEIADLTIDPPAVARPPDGRSIPAHGDVVPREPATGYEYHCVGLRQFDRAEFVIEAEWDVTFPIGVSAADVRQRIDSERVEVTAPGRRGEPLRITKQVPLPEGVIANAETQVKRFIHEMGVDLRLVGGAYEETEPL